jgi:hypothetical protein
LKTMDLKKDDVIRLKTKGDSIIIDSCSKLQQTAQNYSGEGILHFIYCCYYLLSSIINTMYILDLISTKFLPQHYWKAT